MFGSLGAAIYRPLTATSCRSRPWQIALAVAMGAICGLLLMKSVAGTLLLLTLYFLPIHLPAAIVTALMVAGLTPILDPTLGTIGNWLLGMSGVANMIGLANSYPLVPWLRLNNTVINGALAIGVLQLLPTFLLARVLINGCIASYEEQLEMQWYRLDAEHGLELTPNVSYVNTRQREASRSASFSDATESPFAKTNADMLDKGIFDEDAIAAVLDNEPQTQDQIETISSNVVPAHTPVVEIEGDADIAEPDFHPATAEELSSVGSDEDTEWLETESVALGSGDAVAETAERVEAKLSERGDLSDLSAEEVTTRASELADLVGEMLSAIQDGEVQGARKGNAQTSEAPAKEAHATGPQPTADNTNSRRDYSQKPLNSGLTAKHEKGEKVVTDLSATESETLEEELLSVVDEVQGTVLKQHPAHANPQSSDGTQPDNETIANKAVTLEEVAQHEEALRYLLHHLKEIKNRV